MTVVAHHPVVVHLEGITVRLLTIDKDLAIAHLQVVMLIHLDRTLIDGQVIQRQLNTLALLRNPNRTIVIARPALHHVLRIDLVRSVINLWSNCLHQVLSALQQLSRFLGQRHHHTVVTELLSELNLTLALKISLVSTTQSQVLASNTVLL